MSSSFNFKQVLIILSFVRMSYEGNSVTLEDAPVDKFKKDGKETECCFHKKSETPGKAHEIRLRGAGEKYRIPMPRTSKNLLLTESRETDEGELGGREIGFEDSRRSPFHSETQSTSKPENDTKLISKHQKMFFRKTFTGERGGGRGGGGRRKKTIYLLGLFDLTKPKNATKNFRFEDRYEERAEGKSEMLVSKLAVKHVNEKGLNGGYQLQLYSNDTKCDPGVAVDALFYALFSKNTPLPILLGSACSLATASLASITPYWNIVQISFGATSPVLSNRKKFPLFYRIAAPDSSHNAAKLAFIRHFGWNTVTFVSQNEKEYILTVNYFIKILERENVTCKGTVTFGKNDFQDQLNQLKEMDTKIIFASFSEDIAPRVFCKIFELGVYGSDYAWILQGSLKRIWWRNHTECSERNLKKALQGVFFISSYHDPEQSFSFHRNFTGKILRQELSRRGIPMSRYALEAYDAIWTAAVALNESLRSWSRSKPGTGIEDFNYDRYDMAQTIFHKISLINAVGLSGPISFEGADRLGTSVFYQLQGDYLATVAIYSPTNGALNFTCYFCSEIFWEGGQVPVSQRFLLKRIETISFEAFLAVGCSTLIAVIIAVLFLGFNSYFRKLKNIKLSSPKLNNMAVTGCIAVYIGVFLLGLDFATLPKVEYYGVVCTAKIFFFAAGFSLAFGSIFAKTYRVHEIFIKSQGGFIRKKFLQDRQLILLVGVLLLIDVLILTVWVVLDPLQRHLHNSTLEYSTINRSVIYQTQVEICSCKHMNGWLSFLYMYKGLQLLMGVFLAWETRHVKIPGINDSQYIVLSVYSVVITSCIVVVLANLIFEKPTMAYLIISTMILSSTTATLCSLFFPKVKVIFSKSVNNFDPIMHSMGLTLESNTRRFVFDDAKEKLYRLEVQNRVYKREAFSLGNEISRLEKQLMPNVSLPLANNLQTKVTLSNESFQHQSLLDLFDKDVYPKPVYSIGFLARSWPSEIHKIKSLNRSYSLHSGLKIEVFKKNSMTKFVSGKEKMRNFFKNTVYAAKKKEVNLDKGRKEQKRFVLSQYLPFVQKAIQSNEDLREYSVWKINRESIDDKSKLRRKSQPVSRMRFKGSPRFPHKIVPSSFIIPEVEREGRVFSEYNGEEDEIGREVEVIVSSGFDINKVE